MSDDSSFVTLAAGYKKTGVCPHGRRLTGVVPMSFDWSWLLMCDCGITSGAMTEQEAWDNFILGHKMLEASTKRVKSGTITFQKPRTC